MLHFTDGVITNMLLVVIAGLLLDMHGQLRHLTSIVLRDREK
ncbi:MAG: hypothetical protein ABSG25_15805 [Bryobacteraceae bacterium]|jgi:hypothetical protein